MCLGPWPGELPVRLESTEADRLEYIQYHMGWGD